MLLESGAEDGMVQHLKTLGITYLAEWDVLAFIYRSGTSLASAEKIARLVGYSKTAVGSALELLTSTGLVQRSRNSHGVRLYQLASAVPDDSRRRSLKELVRLAEERQGRLLFVRHLQAAAAKQLRGRGGLHLA